MAAETFRRSGQKAGQLRQLYNGLQGIVTPLCEKRIPFGAARERLNALYVERVVRQANRNVIQPPVKALFDAHLDLALKEQRELLGFFRYFKNIYCYFGESDKN